MAKLAPSKSSPPLKGAPRPSPGKATLPKAPKTPMLGAKRGKC